MNSFWNGFGAGLLSMFLGMWFLADQIFSHADKMCELQNWEGKACQCRLLTKGTAKP